MLGLTAATLAQNVPNYVPTNGLIGWWPFSGNANDESGNGNNGTVNGAILTTDRFGYIGKAYSFDGSGDSITTILPAIGNFTFNGWINSSALPSDYPIIYNFNTGLQNNRLLLLGAAYSAIDQGKIFIGDDNGVSNDYQTSFTVNNNNWRMLSVVYDYNSATLKLFVDNNLIVTKSIIGNSNFGGKIKFGNGFSQFTSGNPFYDSKGYVGSIDDIGIWNRALTQQEITDLYNAVNCANNATITPQTNTLTTGNTATFTASTSDPNPSYLWQCDFGQGFQTLNNFGNYSGTNTANLNIANIQLPNHTQPIRVITTSVNCIDTSNVATISIADTCINTVTDTTLITVTDTLLINTNLTGVNPPNNVNTIKIFPNPANDHITINYGNFSVMNGYLLKIENAIGQQVFQTNITQQSDYLNLTTWGGNGLYFVHIINPQGNTIDIRKIVLQ